jgi:hypothetical protein
MRHRDIIKEGRTIGPLMYLMVGTRPDIAYAVSILSQYMEEPHYLHCKAVKRVIRYIKRTLNHGILYNGNNSKDILTEYSEADYGGYKDMRLSTTRFLFLINEGPGALRSRKQKSVSTSSTESEYIACCSAEKKIVWIRLLLEGLYNKLEQPKILHIDNRCAIRLLRNPEMLQRTKHVDIQYLYVREQVKKKKEAPEYVNTQNHLADMFAKQVTPNTFLLLRDEMNIIKNRTKNETL